MIRGLLVFVLLLGTIICVQAQRSSNPKVNKVLAKAQTLAKQGKTDKVDKQLLKLFKKYPDDPAVKSRLAVYHLDKKQYDKAIPVLEEMAEDNPDYVKNWYTLYHVSQKLGNYDEAQGYLATALTKVDPDSKQFSQISRDLKNLQFVKEAKANPVDFDPVRWDDKINSEYLEYLPSVSIDGTVIFTRRINGLENLFICKRDMEGNFTDPVMLDFGQINGNIGAHFLSTDGNMLFVSMDDRRKGYGSFDLFYSQKVDGQFSQLRNLGKTINSSKKDIQPNLSADGNTLYFVSDRNGGMGGTDIYKTTLVDSKWSNPVLLDTTFNTPYNEESPFIHPDGKTFYYRSDGRVGMGDFDIYVTRKDGDTWSTPENIGYPINTETSQGALFVDIHGQKAYYASDEGLDNLDIFEFDLPYEFQPEPVTYLLVRVTDKDRNPLQSTLMITDLATGEETQLMTDGTTGEQSTILDTGKSYAITIKSEGYTFYSAHVDLLDEASAEVPYIYEATLDRIVIAESTSQETVSEPIRLSNIFFNSGEFVLLSTSNTEIQNLVNLLHQNPDTSIQIQGHTDDVGQDIDNMVLSEKRAQAVYDAVVAQGIDRSRLAYKGFGETTPIADNATEEGRRQNRRTEFVIIRK